MKSEQELKPFIGFNEYGMLRFRDEGEAIVVYNSPIHYLYGIVICLAVGIPLSFLIYYLWYNNILSKTPVVILVLITLVVVACLSNIYENLFQRHTVRFDFQHHSIELIKSTFGLNNTTRYYISDIQHLRVTTIQKGVISKSNHKPVKYENPIAYNLTLQLTSKNNISILEFCDIVRLKQLIQQITKSWKQQCEIIIDPNIIKNSVIHL